MFNCHKVLFAVGLSVLPLFGFSSVAYAGWTEGTLQVVDSYLSPYDSGVHVNASVGMKMREWDLDTDSDDNPINGFYAKADIQVSQGNSEYGSTAYDGA
ncbi:MAG: hypothetical protein NTX57_17805, partial [Armatimonadetes bacterium]|nr:hypothetical protein [Armatimonadota bacterium]